ncbi:uncharacterized protein PAC_07829 [Phialocephala subalpina]|uniref:Uncharacterized protein n=1 Tax=Phialocephala subalpina TaxID=576137 RepID=A0A1L7WYU5_9HELO|nr:uncharacterized protein PAC_07829 [Phialocephala subalpina]
MATAPQDQQRALEEEEQPTCIREIQKFPYYIVLRNVHEAVNAETLVSQFPKFNSMGEIRVDRRETKTEIQHYVYFKDWDETFLRKRTYTGTTAFTVELRALARLGRRFAWLEADLPRGHLKVSNVDLLLQRIESNEGTVASQCMRSG